MYDVFGKLGSADEINEVAIALREEGDLENLPKLLEENGLDNWFLEDFIAKKVDFICEDETAAIGKLTIEKAELKKDKYVDVIKERTVNYLIGACEKVEFAKAVRKVDKSLQECMDECVVAIQKELAGSSGGVSDDVVFLAAKNYFKK